MKLKNKKTGEIMDDAQYRNFSLSDGFGFRSGDKEYYYHSLAELNEEWEDAPEEPVYYYFIQDDGRIGCDAVEPYNHKSKVKEHKSIGNYFDTREEAEQAVEKLKAWKRLKDKGFRFLSYFDSSVDAGRIYADFPKEKPSGEVHKDLDLLFGGEE